jgi:hypothetical protein
MLSDLETTIAIIEQQDIELIASIKEGWQWALEKALGLLKWNDQLVVEYNPAIWRISRYPVGLRLFSYPWKNVFIFEFGTPNHVFPFDCFESKEAKFGVMLHEIAHFIDDDYCGFDLRSVIEESRNYVTREQRAELLAFCSYPQGIFEANKSLITATIRNANLDPMDADDLLAFSAIETLGRIGMNRSDNLINFFRELDDKGTFICGILENYVSNYVFSLAGLTPCPDLNESKNFGIKKSRVLAFVTRRLNEYLRKRIDLSSLEDSLKSLNYKVHAEGAISDYNPLRCIDFRFLDVELAESNISPAKLVFDETSSWNCFADLGEALERIEAILCTLEPAN